MTIVVKYNFELIEELSVVWILKDTTVFDEHHLILTYSLCFLQMNPSRQIGNTYSLIILNRLSHCARQPLFQ